MAVNLSLSTLTVVLYLLCGITAASNPAEIRDPPIFQDILSLAADPNEFGNLTLPSAGAEPTCGAGVQKNRNPFAHLFKRADGCESIVSRTTYACASTQFCCTNPGNRLDVWCCQNTAGCAAGTSSTFCTIRVNWVTLTNYATSFTTQYQTSTISLPGNTIYVTLTATTIQFVTKSDIATATSIIFETVTAAAKKRWEATPAVAPPKSTGIAPSTVTAKATPLAKQPQPQVALVTKFHPHGLLARQVMRTTTSTTSILQVITITRSSLVVGTSFYSVSSTRYSTVTTIITSAINARTTVTITSTLTQRPGQTIIVLSTPGQQPPMPTGTLPNGITDNSGPTAGGGGNTAQTTRSATVGGGTGASNGQGSGSGSSGLSKTATIGIGAGTGAGSLIICIIIAFFLHRRRKNRRAENQALIEEAVAAATAAQSPRGTAQFVDYKPAMVGVAPIPMPPRPNHGSPSPHQSERYSDLMLSHHSNGTSPAPEYQNTGYGHEMPLSPMTPAHHNQHQYQYPRPLSPDEVYAPPQPPIEMHHPVPQEISAVYSPRPEFQQPVPGPVYQQSGPGYPQPGMGYQQPAQGYR